MCTLIFTQKFLMFFKGFHGGLFTRILHFIRGYLHHLSSVLRQIFPMFKLILCGLGKDGLLEICGFKTNLRLVFLFRPHLDLRRFWFPSGWSFILSDSIFYMGYDGSRGTVLNNVAVFAFSSHLRVYFAFYFLW